MTRKDIREELYPYFEEVLFYNKPDKIYIRRLENKIIELDKQIIKEI
jgi:hypothetical protein